MKRTTVEIPDDLDARLRHEAQRRGVTISRVSQEALEQYLGRRTLGAAKPAAAAAPTCRSASRRSSRPTSGDSGAAG